MKVNPNVCLTIILLLYCGIAAAADAPPAYAAHCAACHGADGRGRASSAIGKIPDLRTKTISSLSDEELFNAIARGDAHKSYAHSFLNLGVPEPDLRAIVRYIRAMQGRAVNAAPVKEDSSH